MLSYLRDPNLEKLPAEQQAEAEPKKDKEYLTVATREKDVRKSTTILGVLFIIGLICLGVMIKKSAPKAAVAQTEDTEQLQMEAAIARLVGLKQDMFNRMDEIVNKFYEFSDVFQVEVSELTKNPFQLETFLANLNPEDGESEIDAEMIWREQVKNKAKDLKLYSVMGVCCMINNKVLYEGEKIEDFVIKEIGSDNVILELEGIEITLNISR